MKNSFIEKIELTAEESRLCQKLTERKRESRERLGIFSPGRSRIRTNTAEREKHVWNDSLVGITGECAMSLYLFGNIQPFLAAREQADNNTLRGDGGSDFLEIKLDVKSSAIRHKHLSLSSYHLYVPPQELHKVDYALCLVDLPNTIYLIGWTDYDSLVNTKGTNKKFPGFCCIQGKELNAMSEYWMRMF